MIDDEFKILVTFQTTKKTGLSLPTIAKQKFEKKLETNEHVSELFLCNVQYILSPSHRRWNSRFLALLMCMVNSD